MGIQAKVNHATIHKKTYKKVHAFQLNKMTATNSLSRKFKMAFDKSLDKLFPSADEQDQYLHPMGMQPFMSTSCHVTMIGAGTHPRHAAPTRKYWRSFPEMASSSNTLDSLDSSAESISTKSNNSNRK